MDLSVSFAFLLAGGPLDVDRTFFYILGLFLVVIFMTNALVFKPLMKVIAERERRTGGSLKESRDTLDTYSKRMAEYEKALDEARAVGYQVREKQRAEAVKERNEIVAGVKKEMTEQLAKEKGVIEAQVDAAKATLARDAVVMAARISSTILGRSVGGAQ